MEEKVEIIWSASALIMLAELHEYSSEESELSADKYVEGIHSSLSKLEKHPEACAENQKVSILAVVHSSRSSATINEIMK